MRLIAGLGLCVLLAGCSDFSGLFADADDADQAATADVRPVAAATPAPAAVDDGFCRDVAASDATGHGFDQATQTRMAQQSLAQCKALFAR